MIAGIERERRLLVRPGLSASGENVLRFLCCRNAAHTTTTPERAMAHTCAHPLELLAVAAVAAGRVLRPLFVAVVALLLLLAGYRPAVAAPAPAAPIAATVAAPAVARERDQRPIEALTVRELRQRAREAGHKALARNGRRAELLAALS